MPGVGGWRVRAAGPSVGPFAWAGEAVFRGGKGGDRWAGSVIGDHTTTLSERTTFL